MRNRTKAPRPTHPLLVAASALSRATDPASPSRLTVLRLLGDAYGALYESHATLAAIKARSSAHLSSDSSHQSLTRYQIEADMRFRHAHNEGSRALFSVTVTALIKLPSRGGPLRRRAIDIIRLASQATGPASAMAAVDRLRSHISALKRLSWSEVDPSDFDVSASILALADISTCPVASREVARESILFLLGQRIRQKCRRGDLSHAMAVILASYPLHAPPDDRIVDLVLEYCLSPSSTKQGSATFGNALLTAVIAPFVVNRGPSAGDDIVLSSTRPLSTSSTPTERAMWAIAIARASVTARRSTTFQLRKYGNSELGSKFPKVALSTSRDQIPSTSDPSIWISNEIFEEALVQVATATGAPDGSTTATIAVAAVLRMWLQALPSSISVVVSRTIIRLSPLLKSVTALSILVDALWIGVLNRLKPSQSPVVLDGLFIHLSDRGIIFPLTLTTCAAIISRFGRQCLRESALSTDYNTNTTLLIQRIHDALQSSVPIVRFSGVRAMSAVLQSLPRTCSLFLTAVLQNVRIADLNLATKHSSLASLEIGVCEKEIGPLLGNAAAMSVLLEMISPMSLSVPGPLVQRSVFDIFALLKPHHAFSDPNSNSPILTCARRRVAWALIASCARGKRRDVFTTSVMETLLQFWTEELKIPGNKYSKTTGSFSIANGPMLNNLSGDASATALEEATAHSLTRAAALYSLLHVLFNFSSEPTEQFARTITGACAGRVIALLSNLNPSSQTGSPQGPFMGFSVNRAVSTDSSSAPSKNQALASLLSALSLEASQLVQIIALVPPHGDSGELCFLISLALAEEAQQGIGESDAGHVTNSHVVNGANTSSNDTQSRSVLSNRQNSLLTLRSFGSDCEVLVRSKLIQSSEWSPQGTSTSTYDPDDTAWLFTATDVHPPLAEKVFVHCAKAIAAVVAEDLLAHGTLIESLPGAKLSPPLCAAISLEMTKRLSQTNLAEMNRALAVLQVLVRRALGVTGGTRMALLSQSKLGRLYAPNSMGDSGNFCESDVPGSALLTMSCPEGRTSWARYFGGECFLSSLPFHNLHTKAFGVMCATRLILSDAIRELSITGGPTLWIGLVKRITGIVRDNLTCGSPSQFVTASNAISVLGALLEVVPDRSFEASQTKVQAFKHCSDKSGDLKAISGEAIDILMIALESEKPHVQAAAALAFSNHSHVVASHSERITGALLRAWALDRGSFGCLGHFGQCSEETDVWNACFLRMWSDMGVKQADHTPRFIEQGASGIGGLSPAFAFGAAEVVGACSRYWWPLSEPTFHAIQEVGTDLVQWNGLSSQAARIAGLLAITSVWSRRIDLAHARRTTTMGATPTQNTNLKDCGEAILEVDSFSLKDTSRLSNQLGPYLDEVIYDALAPNIGKTGFQELRTIASSAVSEMLRGLGVEVSCANLVRLPETLFVAVEEGTPGACELIEALVQKDACKRPRYWFGLCRAIVLSGERLNCGLAGTTWDVSYQTKAYAVRIAAEAVDSSIAHCDCRRTEESNKHECAIGFLRKIFDFVKQVCSAASFDFECCAHGCRLLLNIATRIKIWGSKSKKLDSAVEEFLSMWDPCVAMMYTLLNDRVPHMVVNSAATAVSELLVCVLRFEVGYKRDMSLGKAPMVSSYIQAFVDTDLRRRLAYTDQGEEICMEALVALISKYGRVMSTLRTYLFGINSNLYDSFNPGDSIKTLFFALCGDFISSNDERDIFELHANGGSLIPARMSEKLIRESLNPHILPIVLGAISCINGQEIGLSSFQVTWHNNDAFGAIMAKENAKYEGVTLAILVQLLKAEHSGSSTKAKQVTLCDQMQETLEYLFRVPANKETSVLRKEVLFCLASWSQTEVLKLGERISQFSNLSADVSSLFSDMVLSLTLNAARNEFQSFQESETETLCRSLSVLSSMIQICRGSKEQWSKRYAEQTIGVLFDMICEDSVILPLLLCEVNVQEALSDLVKVCTNTVGNDKVISACEEKLRTVFENGHNINNKALVKGSLVIAASLSSRVEEDVTDFLFTLIVQDSTTNCTGNGSLNTLALSLDCYGVEGCLLKYVAKYAENDNIRLHRLLFAFGTILTSDEDYSIPVALRCAEAAVVAEGKQCENVNRMGMILYAAFLSELIEVLPTKPREVWRDLSTRVCECIRCLKELVDDEIQLLGGWLPILTESERLKVRHFLSELNEHNAWQTTLTVTGS